MVAIARTPQNTNFLQPSKFLMAFGRIPTVSYFCQSANLPGVSLGSAQMNTPLLDVPLAGTKLEYSEFDMQFYIDEDLASWNELYLWMQSIASPVSLEERRRLTTLSNEGKPTNSYYSEGTLVVLSALNNPLAKINFHRIFPISLSDISFDTTLDADNILTATAKFRYEYFDITNA